MKPEQLIAEQSWGLPVRVGVSRALARIDHSHGTPAYQPSGGYCKAYRMGGQTLPGSIWTKVNLNAEAWDQDNNFDPTTNYRFVNPQAGRYFQVVGKIYFISVVAGEYVIAGIHVSGELVAHCVVQVPFNGNLSAIVYYEGSLALNDYIELFAFCGSAGDLYGSLESTFMVVKAVKG